MRHFPAILLSVLMLAGCSALSRVSEASAPLDAYTLSPVRAAGGSGSRHLVVPVPAATGAVGADRILVKPNRLQAAYLPAGRWVDPAPALVQSLLVNSLQSGGGFRLVSRDDAGLTPDYVLLVDLTDFQAEAPAVEGAVWTIRVGMTATVVRDEDRSIIASRRFDATATAPSDDTVAVVQAFDAAAGKVLTDATAWVVRQTR